MTCRALIPSTFFAVYLVRESNILVDVGAVFLHAGRMVLTGAIFHIFSL
jgi:hypothetical protein